MDNFEDSLSSFFSYSGICDIPSSSFRQSLKNSLLPLQIPNILQYYDNCLLWLEKFHSKNLYQFLTDDEAMAIHLYTLEWFERDDSIYYNLNRALRNRYDFKKWIPYFSILWRGLHKLPRFNGTLWRSIDMDLPKDSYETGKKIRWSAFSSATPKLSRTTQSNSPKVIMCIDCCYGVSISSFSAFPLEEEVLIFPGACMEVLGCTCFDDMKVLQLKQNLDDGISPPLRMPPNDVNQNICQKEYPHDHRSIVLQPPTVSLKDTISKFTNTNLASILIEQLDHWEMVFQHENIQTELTVEQMMSIRTLTTETRPPLELLINNLNFAEDQHDFFQYKSFLQILISALRKIPSCSFSNLWWNSNFSEKSSKSYPKGQTIMHWSITSCYPLDVLSAFVPRINQKSIFKIDCIDARPISKYTLFPKENEHLLLPGYFEVVDSVVYGNLEIIHLKQIVTTMPSVQPIQLNSAIFPQMQTVQSKITNLFSVDTYNLVKKHLEDIVTKKTEKTRCTLFDALEEELDELNLKEDLYLLRKIKPKLNFKEFKIDDYSASFQVYYPPTSKLQQAGSSGASSAFSGMAYYRQTLTIEHSVLTMSEICSGKKPSDSCIQVVLTLSQHFSFGDNLNIITKQCCNWYKGWKFTNKGDLLDENEVIAIVLYTHDLGNQAKKEENFYFQLNNVLRKRVNTELNAWSGYLYYVLTALKKLPNAQTTVYRGIPADSIDKVKQEYILHRPIHWSGFSSATNNIKVAKGFAGENGIIFRIKIYNGKDIQKYSFIPSEDELLLSPNMKFKVRNELHEEGGCLYVDLEQKQKQFVY